MNKPTLEEILKSSGYTDPYCASGVGAGWLSILADLIPKLKAAGVTRIAQVKEKFGGLRVYIDGGSAEAYRFIGEAEARAWETCEDCGATEGVKTGGRGWIRTLCSACQSAQAAAQARRDAEHTERMLKREAAKREGGE